MSDIKPLHRPKWQPVEDDWHMIVGNQSVAVLIPNSCSTQPWANWISCILTDYQLSQTSATSTSSRWRCIEILASCGT